MASNSTGTIFRVTTWGESHGKALGVVIDGCPAGLELDENDIIKELKKRSPGHSSYTSPRKESDIPEILSGVFEGKTTGMPISIIIYNRDVDSSSYTPLKTLFRPGHANFTYLSKYGVFDHNGGGRASARETVCRVAAGAVAKKILDYYGISSLAFLSCVGDLSLEKKPVTDADVALSPIFCPDQAVSDKIIEKLQSVIREKDSIGGTVSFIARGLPAGLGEPVYEKLEANLAKAMLSIPASKGFEIGSGFEALKLKGSEHNDIFFVENGRTVTRTNHAGGTLGGISTGMPLEGRVAFKPTSSIKKDQKTVSISGEEEVYHIQESARHDPCVAIRAVPVVEAMLALVLVDALLLNRLCKL